MHVLNRANEEISKLSLDFICVLMDEKRTRSSFFYITDMNVMIDILIREIRDLASESLLRVAHIKTLEKILLQSPWFDSGMYARAEIVLALEAVIHEYDSDHTFSKESYDAANDMYHSCGDLLEPDEGEDRTTVVVDDVMNKMETKGGIIETDTDENIDEKINNGDDGDNSETKNSSSDDGEGNLDNKTEEMKFGDSNNDDDEKKKMNIEAETNDDDDDDDDTRTNDKADTGDVIMTTDAKDGHDDPTTNDDGEMNEKDSGDLAQTDMAEDADTPPVAKNTMMTPE